jgi:hypothetical protein
VDGTNGLRETTLSVNIFTAPGKAMVGERPKPLKSGEYITQVTAIGPLGLEYVNAKDDPRNENSTR